MNKILTKFVTWIKGTEPKIELAILTKEETKEGMHKQVFKEASACYMEDDELWKEGRDKLNDYMKLLLKKYNLKNGQFDFKKGKIYQLTKPKKENKKLE